MTRNLSTFVRQSGFTLIELLTVIGIIAVLAGLTVGLTAAAKNARTNSRAQAELQQLQTAIERYKADRNAYPPDHVLQNARAKVDPNINQLYYELIGTDVANGRFIPRGQKPGATDGLTPDKLEEVFGRRGFLNSSSDPSEPARTYLDPKGSAVRPVKVGGVDVQLLATPFDWPASSREAPPIPGTRMNPWRYVSTSPTNNHGGFDLWAEVYVSKEKRLFKNW